MAEKKIQKIEYEIVMRNETVRVVVPADWKVTYGTLHGGGGAKDFGERAVYLRFYEANEKQRMVFADVKSFRDLSIPMKRKIRKEALKIEKSGDSKGNTKAASAQQVDEAWEDA